MASVCPSTQWIFLQELQSQSSELQAFERVFGFDVAEPQCQAIASKKINMDETKFVRAVSNETRIQLERGDTLWQF